MRLDWRRARRAERNLIEEVFQALDGESDADITRDGWLHPLGQAFFIPRVIVAGIQEEDCAVIMPVADAATEGLI